MKKLILLLIAIITCSCKSEAQNDFDEIIHYSITDEKVAINENNNSFNKLYSGLESSGSIEKDFEQKLISFGYVKKNIPKEDVIKVGKTISADINLKYHEVACIPMYRDILVFRKQNKTKAIIKICFECGMNNILGKFESNFNYKTKNIMSNYEPLYNLLHKD